MSLLFGSQFACFISLVGVFKLKTTRNASQAAHKHTHANCFVLLLLGSIDYSRWLAPKADDEGARNDKSDEDDENDWKH